ncbi:hypothetical protein BTS2_0700 [Bacillus sp. TS-2]|nr:hypothetical protein BTS2_0700 [Bacillus sp. TS-2]
MENHMLELDEQKNELGKVEISPEVIEVIAGIAAAEVEGVATMRGNFASGVAEKLGRKNHGKGVRVQLNEDGIKVDVSVVITYGVSVPEVAKLIQSNIQQALQTMTAIELKEINVHVVGIQFEQADSIEEA